MKWKTKIIFGFFIIAVFVFALFVPPFQKADEPTHFFRAMALSEGQFFCIPSSKGSSFTLPMSVYTFAQKFLTGDIVMRYGAKFPIGTLKQSYPYRASQERTDSFSYCFLPFPAYVFFAAGAILTVPFDNLLVMFYAMRIVSAFLFILFAWFGYRMIPERYKSLFLLFICNPMVIHQATSVSYDATLLACICLIFPMWLSLLDKKRISFVTLFFFGGLLALSCVIKPGYFFLCGLIVPLFSKIPWKRYGVLIFILASIVFGILVYFAGTYGVTFTYFSNPQFSIIFKDPWYFVSVIGRTIFSTHEDLFAGMIGLFGWIDYKLPSYAVFLYMIITGVVIGQYVKKETKRLSGWVMILLGAVLLGTIFFIFYHFYSAATPQAYTTIVGLQGRYMLPLLPFFAVFVLEVIMYLKEKKMLWIGVTGVGMIGIMAITASIYYRYYDYSKSFSNFDDFKTAIVKKTLDTETLSPVTMDSSHSYSYEVKQGYKIGGFQLLATNELFVSTSYRYTVKDTTCSKILQKGYLNELRDSRLSFLKGEDDLLITQYMPLTTVAEDTVCFTLEPVFTSNSQTYLILLGVGKKPLVQFLYISK